MTQLFVKNTDGACVLAETLTYGVLGPDWGILLQDFLALDNTLVLDFANIKRVDSSFLAFLLALLRAMQQRHAVLSIKHMTDDIQSLMQVQGIWPLFKELMD